MPALATARVTSPDVPPPVRPVPELTPVMSPPPPGVAEMVRVCPDGVIETLEPACRVTASRTPLRLRTTVWSAIVPEVTPSSARPNGELAVPSPLRVSSWTTLSRPPPPPRLDYGLSLASLLASRGQEGEAAQVLVEMRSLP
jgi:hypothetical protein